MTVIASSEAGQGQEELDDRVDVRGPAGHDEQGSPAEHAVRAFDVREDFVAVERPHPGRSAKMFTS